MRRRGRPDITWATPQIGLRIGFAKSDFTVTLSSTHDGGETWRSLRSPCPDAANLAFASLPTPKLWWLICEPVPQGATTAKALFSTRNAGKSWTQAASTANRRLNSRGSVADIEFAPDGFGFLDVAGWVSELPPYVTRDGGTTWTKLPSGIEPVAALTGGLGYALRSGHNPLPATLLKTRDHGRTWHAVRRWDG